MKRGMLGNRRPLLAGNAKGVKGENNRTSYIVELMIQYELKHYGFTVFGNKASQALGVPESGETQNENENS